MQGTCGDFALVRDEKWWFLLVEEPIAYAAGPQHGRGIPGASMQRSSGSWSTSEGGSWCECLSEQQPKHCTGDPVSSRDLYPNRRIASIQYGDGGHSIEDRFRIFAVAPLDHFARLVILLVHLHCMYKRISGLCTFQKKQGMRWRLIRPWTLSVG